MTTKTVKWLSTLDLENFVDKFADEKTKVAFLGVFPINCLPRNISRLPVLFIVNTNSANLPGQHWKAVYVSENRIGEIFDSLATIVSLRLEQWMNCFTKRWTLSKYTLQNPLSPTCGGYVLYYIMTRLKHKSMNSCISVFKNDIVYNDIFVERFFNEHFK